MRRDKALSKLDVPDETLQISNFGALSSALIKFTSCKKRFCILRNLHPAGVRPSVSFDHVWWCCDRTSVNQANQLASLTQALVVFTKCWYLLARHAWATLLFLDNCLELPRALLRKTSSTTMKMILHEPLAHNLDQQNSTQLHNNTDAIQYVGGWNQIIAKNDTYS